MDELRLYAESVNGEDWTLQWLKPDDVEAEKSLGLMVIPADEWMRRAE